MLFIFNQYSLYQNAFNAIWSCNTWPIGDKIAWLADQKHWYVIYGIIHQNIIMTVHSSTCKRLVLMWLSPTMLSSLYLNNYLALEHITCPSLKSAYTLMNDCNKIEQWHYTQLSVSSAKGPGKCISFQNTKDHETNCNLMMFSYG